MLTKNLLALLIFIFLIPSLGYAGNGKIAPPMLLQESLEEKNQIIIHELVVHENESTEDLLGISTVRILTSDNKKRLSTTIRIRPIVK